MSWYWLVGLVVATAAVMIGWHALIYLHVRYKPWSLLIKWNQDRGKVIAAVRHLGQSYKELKAQYAECQKTYVKTLPYLESEMRQQLERQMEDLQPKDSMVPSVFSYQQRMSRLLPYFEWHMDRLASQIETEQRALDQLQHELMLFTFKVDRLWRQIQSAERVVSNAVHYVSQLKPKMQALNERLPQHSQPLQVKATRFVQAAQEAKQLFEQKEYIMAEQVATEAISVYKELLMAIEALERSEQVIAVQVQGLADLLDRADQLILQQQGNLDKLRATYSTECWSDVAAFVDRAGAMVAKSRSDLAKLAGFRQLSVRQWPEILRVANKGMSGVQSLVGQLQQADSRLASLDQMTKELPAKYQAVGATCERLWQYITANLATLSMRDRNKELWEELQAQENRFYSLQTAIQQPQRNIISITQALNQIATRLIITERGLTQAAGSVVTRR